MSFITGYIFFPSVSIGDICVYNLIIKRLRLQFVTEPQLKREVFIILFCIFYVGVLWFQTFLSGFFWHNHAPSGR